MRRAVYGLGLAAMCLAATTAKAQAPVIPPNPSASGFTRATPPGLVPGAPSKVRREVTEADQMIYERAVVRARMRDLRIEGRKLIGYSPLRPDVRHGHYNNDLNRYFWAQPYGYYYAPMAGTYPVPY